MWEEKNESTFIREGGYQKFKLFRLKDKLQIGCKFMVSTK